MDNQNLKLSWQNTILLINPIDKAKQIIKFFI